MPTDLAQSATLVGAEASEKEQALVTELDRWVSKAPILDSRLIQISNEENSRRRRLALWTLLAEQNHMSRQRLLEGIIGAAHREDVSGLRLFFGFMCGRPTTYEQPERISILRNLRRLGRRLRFHQAPRDDAELTWLEELHEIISPDCDPELFEVELRPHRQAIDAMFRSNDDFPHPLPEHLGRLISLEGRAASLRGARLVDRVGDYDPIALARLLPLVVALDEWQGDLMSLVERGSSALKHPLEEFLGDEELRDWRKHLDRSEDLPGRLLASWVGWMNGTEMVGNEPAAWVGLLRTLGEKRYRKTIHAALLLPRRWRKRRLGLSTKPPTQLFRARAISKSEDLFWVDLDELLWAEWVSPDGRPMSAEGWRDEESPLALLRSRLQDDAFCERILDNELWCERFGVVESIARGSRSLRVLLRICRERRLHSGAANRPVPLALLENPAHIPLSALRPFMGPRYISRHDFSRLSRGDAGIRREISQEARRLMTRN